MNIFPGASRISASTFRISTRRRRIRRLLERDRIAVKGAPMGEPFEQFVNAHGPIFTGPTGKPVALRWVAAENVPFRIGLVKLNRARNWQQFRDALREFPGAASNVAYADKEGNIGLQVTGELPIRKGCNGQRISPAGTCEWRGFIPFDELPSFYNPASGRIVSGESESVPGEVSVHRQRQLRAALPRQSNSRRVDSKG